MKWYVLCWTLHYMYCCKIPLHLMMGLKWIAYIEYVTDRVWHNSNVLNMLQTRPGITVMY